MNVNNYLINSCILQPYTVPHQGLLFLIYLSMQRNTYREESCSLYKMAFISIHCLLRSDDYLKSLS